MKKIAGSGSASGSGLESEAWIRGSGSDSTPKCHASGTLLFRLGGSGITFLKTKWMQLENIQLKVAKFFVCSLIAAGVSVQSSEEFLITNTYSLTYLLTVDRDFVCEKCFIRNIFKVIPHLRPRRTTPPPKKYLVVQNKVLRMIF
jgi:hypothetical protein